MRKSIYKMSKDLGNYMIFNYILFGTLFLTMWYHSGSNHGIIIVWLQGLCSWTSATFTFIGSNYNFHLQLSYLYDLKMTKDD